VLFAAACNRSNIDNKEAVRQGVVDYLAKRKQQTGLDMNLMNVEVSNVTFEKNEAKAMVSFKPKGSEGASGGMTMGYTLERQGDKWIVKGRQESGLNPHGGGAMGSPGGTPGAVEPGAQMPPNHPPVPGAKPVEK
jgi:hypothetical protein